MPLQVQKLSPEAQAIIRSYTDQLTPAHTTASTSTAHSGPGASTTHAAPSGSTTSAALSAWTAAMTQTLPWRTPSREDYLALLDETEYGAW